MRSNQILYPLLPVFFSILFLECTNTNEELEGAKQLHETVNTVDTHVDINNGAL